MRLHLFVFAVCFFSLYVFAGAQVPSTLKLESLPGQSADNDSIKLTNMDTSPLVAYVYKGNCGKVMNTRGYSDAALVYSTPLDVGKSTFIATVAAGCKVSVDAAIFADGRSFGTPSALHFIAARRAAAGQELSTILHEVYDTNGTHSFDPDELDARVAQYKLSIDPSFRKYPEREEEARNEVLDALRQQIDIYKRMKAEDPGDEALRSRLEQLLTAWLAELTNKRYPETRRHLYLKSNP